MSITQDLLHYFDTRGRDNPHHNITSRSRNQEAIQFRAAEDVIDHGLGSNHGPPDSQADPLSIKLSHS